MPSLPVFPIQKFVPITYIGSLNAVNVALLTGGGTWSNAGQQITQPHQSQVVNTTYNWLTDYGNNNAVTVNMQTSPNGAPLIDKLLMVYINNANNANDVTVYFQDSGMFITAPAGSAGYYPVMTNLFLCNVYNGYTGIGNGGQGGSETQIIFCNFAVPGFLSQSQQTVSGYVLSPPLIATSIVSSAVILNGPRTIAIYGIGFYGLDIVSIAAGAVRADCQIYDTGTFGSQIATYNSFQVAAVASQTLVPAQPFKSYIFNPVPLLITIAGNLVLQCTVINANTLQAVVYAELYFNNTSL